MNNKPLFLDLPFELEHWSASFFAIPRLQAHRGYWVEGAQENTLEAFAAAKAKGYQMFECDVQLSRDGIPVVYHDEFLSRFAKDHQRVSDLTADELWAKVRAPKLEDVLMSSDRPDLVNIELKAKYFFNPVLEEAVCQTITKTKQVDRVLISSFNPFSLWRVGQRLETVPRALLATTQRAPLNNIFLRHMVCAPFIGVHLLHLSSDDFSVEDLGRFENKGVRFAVWTVNDLVYSKAATERGALSIISDKLLP